MVSLASLNSKHQHFNTMNYPEPPQGVFASPPLDMGLSPESYYSTRPSHHEAAYHQHHQQTTMAYGNGSLYASEAPYMYGGGNTNNGRSSPSMYPEDGDMRVPSSNLSTASASSSTVGSPLSNHGQLAPMIPEWAQHQGLGVVSPVIVDHQGGGGDYFANADYFQPAGMVDGYIDFVPAPKGPGFVDPTMIHHHHHDMNRPAMGIPYEHPFQNQQPYPASPSLSPRDVLRHGSASPFMQQQPNSNYPSYAHSPYAAPVPVDQRRPSIVSFVSNNGSGNNAGYSREPTYSGDEAKEKQRCPHPDCGKQFKDIKAHMLTHMAERPEKCPIQTCDYHTKGFSRKYDKNRHTLTHYKGTMVCGFCPGSGSAAEKSFNRADVFKRHLTAVHGVEQTPPNSRKKTTTIGGSSPAGNMKKLTGYAPDATGKCSTCSSTFSNAQDFYEHLDDCVLRIVQQEDPAEAVNAQRLAEVENDKDVHETLEKNQLPTTITSTPSLEEDVADEDMIDEDEEDFDEDSKADRKGGASLSTASSPTKRKGNPANGVQKSRGLTHSRGGVPLLTKNRGRKNRKDYPSSWAFDKGQMKMKKRVMAVFDGPRRLAKDDMMLSTDCEVRIPLPSDSSNKGQQAYVTDLDIQTLKRAEGFLGATEDEKGAWISDDPTDDELKKMLECGSSNTTTTTSAAVAVQS